MSLQRAHDDSSRVARRVSTLLPSPHFSQCGCRDDSSGAGGQGRVCRWCGQLSSPEASIEGFHACHGADPGREAVWRGGRRVPLPSPLLLRTLDALPAVTDDTPSSVTRQAYFSMQPSCGAGPSPPRSHTDPPELAQFPLAPPPLRLPPRLVCRDWGGRSGASESVTSKPGGGHIAGVAAPILTAPSRKNRGSATSPRALRRGRLVERGAGGTR